MAIAMTDRTNNPSQPGERKLLRWILVLQIVILGWLAKNHLDGAFNRRSHNQPTAVATQPDTPPSLEPSAMNAPSSSSLFPRLSLFRRTPPPPRRLRHPATHLRAEMERMMDEANQAFADFDSFFGMDDAWAALPASPSMNMRELDDAYELSLAIRPARQRARAARRRARPRQDPRRAHPRLPRSTRFKRIQFTPTCCPPTSSARRSTTPRTATFHPQGPVFAKIILADEINRAPAKVQSALLEAMQERQVTIGDTRPIKLPDPFLVLATENPIEQEGTYPLPEAQVDRFMFKLRVGYPDPRRGAPDPRPPRLHRPPPAPR
jgi:hypothetical protein